MKIELISLFRKIKSFFVKPSVPGLENKGERFEKPYRMGSGAPKARAPKGGRLLVVALALCVGSCWEIPTPPTPTPPVTTTTTTTTMPEPPPTAPPTEEPPQQGKNIYGVTPIPALPTLWLEATEIAKAEFGCNVGACATGTTPQLGLQRVIEAARESGLNAGLNRDGEAVLLSKGCSRGEEYHIITWGEPSMVAWPVDPATRPNAKPCHGTPCKDDEKLGSYRGDWEIECGTDPGGTPTPDPGACPDQLKPTQPMGCEFSEKTNPGQWPCYGYGSPRHPHGGEVPAECLPGIMVGGPLWYGDSGSVEFTDANGHDGDTWYRWRRGSGQFAICASGLNGLKYCSIYRAKADCTQTFVRSEIR